MPPSKLIVKCFFPPSFFLLGGVNYEGGRSNHKSSFMRGVIVPPSKLIVKKCFPPKVFFNWGGLIIKGGRLYTCTHTYTHTYLIRAGEARRAAPSHAVTITITMI